MTEGARRITMVNTAVVSIIFVALAGKIVLAAEGDFRFVEKTKFPDAPEILVVAEGDFEPRSIGSYSIRIYSGANPDFPVDDYVAGVIRPRDGVIESVQFQDLGRGVPEVIVIIRSAGSGGYLSADAFSYAKKSLKLVASVARLAKDADPIPALIQEIKKGS
jgi:Periplasmic lysozyme inhibitor of I-type lysozyme